MSKNIKIIPLRGRVLRRVAFSMLYLAGIILFLAGGTLIFIQSDYGQEFGRKHLVLFLETKLHTKVGIGHIDVAFPKMLVLEDFFILDQTKDTLASGKKLMVDVDMLKLLQSKVQVNEILLSESLVNIQRQEHDIHFNYQFIVDAFSLPADSISKDTSSLIISIGRITCRKTRWQYNDVPEGNNLHVFIDHLSAKIETFDPDKLLFSVPLLNVDGLQGSFIQSAPLKITAVQTGHPQSLANQSQAFLKLMNNKTILKNISFQYQTATNGLNGNINIAFLEMYPGQLDFEKSVIVLDRIKGKGITARVRSSTSKEPGAVIQFKTDKDSNIAVAEMPWKLSIREMTLADGDLQWDNDAKLKVPLGIDYNHLHVSKANFVVNNLLFNKDSLGINIINARLYEKSGFELIDFSGNVLKSQAKVILNNVHLITPFSDIRTTTDLYLSLPGSAAKSSEIAGFDINLGSSYISNADVLLLSPFLSKYPAFSRKYATTGFSGKISGSSKKVFIERLKVKGLNHTILEMSGSINNPAHVESASWNINLVNISTSAMDIRMVVPSSLLPKDISLPERFNIKAKLNGNIQQTFADININSTLGTASVTGKINNLLNPDKLQYNGIVRANAVQLGSLINQTETVGEVAGKFNIIGRGFDPSNATIQVNGFLDYLDIQHYRYRKIYVNASMIRKVLKSTITIKDPNVRMRMDITAKTGLQLRDVLVSAEIDSLKTMPLGFTANPIIWQGKMVAAFPVVDLDSLQGKIDITNGYLLAAGKRIQIDTVSVSALYKGGLQTLQIKAPFGNVEMTGKYQVKNIGNIVLQSFKPYYSLPVASTYKPIQQYNIIVQLHLVEHPLFYSLFPGLQQFGGLDFSANLSDSAGIRGAAQLSGLTYLDQHIDTTSLMVTTTAMGLQFNASIRSFSSGPGIHLYKTVANVIVLNNIFDFSLMTHDNAGKVKYAFNGIVTAINKEDLVLNIKPDPLLLNYESWHVAPENEWHWTGNSFTVRNFDLYNQGQHLNISSRLSPDKNILDITFKNFSISTLSALVQNDTLQVNGLMNGDVVMKNILEQPAFTSDVLISNVSVQNDTIGDIRIKINNSSSDDYVMNASLLGRGNLVRLSGVYKLRPDSKSEIDVKIDLEKLSLKTVQVMSLGKIDSAVGYLGGKVEIKGQMRSPKLNGKIDFKQTRFYVPALGEFFAVNNEAVVLDDQGVKFDTFRIRDSANNVLIIDGVALTNNLVNYHFALNIKSRDFRAMNIARQKNSLYYGQLYLTTNIGIKGTELAPVIDGKLIVNEKTNLTVVIPQEERGFEERKGIVEFVDMDSVWKDSIHHSLTLQYDTIFNSSSLKGLDVSLNIEVVKEANLNLVIDEANGDLVNLQGQALLTGGIDPGGKITLTGTYELEKGGYEISFNFLRRKFEIQKGSRITWTGEPTTAQMDVSAVYIANTSAVDLVQNQVNDDTKPYYQQKLPFQVLLKMQGEILKPEITFDINLPVENNARVSNEVLTTIETRLQQIKQEPSELNKQVFALLLLNRFVAENPFQSNGNGGFDAASFARQSVSKILSDQLNKLAADLISGIDISFDVNSADDYTTGVRRDRTDFNLQLSKKILNDRLKVTVGSSYELEGPQQGSASNASNVIGNVSVDYNLSKDGRLLLRGYRKNDYDAIIEGMVIETGVKFIISVDYNRFREIFKRRRKPSKRTSAAPVQAKKIAHIQFFLPQDTVEFKDNPLKRDVKIPVIIDLPFIAQQSKPTTNGY